MSAPQSMSGEGPRTSRGQRWQLALRASRPGSHSRTCTLLLEAGSPMIWPAEGASAGGAGGAISTGCGLGTPLGSAPQPAASHPVVLPAPAGSPAGRLGVVRGPCTRMGEALRRRWSSSRAEEVRGGDGPGRLANGRGALRLVMSLGKLTCELVRAPCRAASVTAGRLCWVARPALAGWQNSGVLCSVACGCAWVRYRVLCPPDGGLRSKFKCTTRLPALGSQCPEGRGHTSTCFTCPAVVPFCLGRSLCVGM
jgi:hypothetical protein